jgi:hypothetical protein
MHNRLARILFVGAVALASPLSPLTTPAAAQSNAASRDITRDRLVSLLDTVGKRSDVNIPFHRSDKNAYNVVGLLKTGLRNSDSFEVIWGASKDETIGLRIYPHYNGGYINLDKVRDYPGFMRALLKLNGNNFMYWGADDTNDVFVSYQITLESGFPSEAVTVVTRSIPGQDKYLGELRPYIDGTHAQ